MTKHNRQRDRTGTLVRLEKSRQQSAKDVGKTQ